MTITPADCAMCGKDPCDCGFEAAHTPTYLYVIRELTDDGNVKIGYSKAPYDRLERMQTGNSRRLGVILMQPIPSHLMPQSVEGAIHKLLVAERAHGEWFVRGQGVMDLLRHMPETGVMGWIDRWCRTYGHCVKIKNRAGIAID